MVATLDTDVVSKVLDGLFAAAEGDDAQFDRLRAELGDRSPYSIDSITLSELAANVVMPVSRDTGRLLYQLVRATRARFVVEFGTSFGVAAVHLAAGLRDNGGGRLVTTELSPGKARAAEDNLAAAGLADLVEIRVGDAHETLASLTEEVDLLLLDGWNNLYLPVLRLVEPRLRPGAVVVADDLDQAEATSGYLGYVRDPASGYVSLPLPVDEGLELSIRC